jgi:hypothetical protein
MSAAELLNLHSSSSSSTAAAADIVVSSSSSVSEFCSSKIIQGSLDQHEHVQQSHGSATHELDKQLVINVAATSDDNNNNQTFPHSSQQQQQQQQQQSLAGRVKGQWGCAEDRIVSKLVNRYGTRRWSLISTFLASESVSFCIILLTAMLSLSSSSSPSSSSSSSSSVSLVLFFPCFWI